MPDLVIRNGQLVTPEGILNASVAIDDGRISAIGPDLAGGTRETDASNCYVLPGLIDVHVHFNEPGRADWEGCSTGSRALAAGGGTLFFDMPLNSTPCLLTGWDFEAKRAALARSSVTNFAMWGGLVPGNLSHMAELADLGVVGFKAFMCDSGLPEFPRADDLTLYEGMREAARLGRPVAVHAESEELTRAPRRSMDIRGFLDSRPVLAETEAIQRAGLFARETRCRLHIVHISSGRGVAAALEARSHGADISIETCPHYLFFTEDDLLRIGALAKCAPPLRSCAERESLWHCLLQNQVDIVASDHSPCPPNLKQRDNFFEIWGGIAGVQSTLPVLLQDQRLTLSRIAELTGGNPAKRFGIKHRGVIKAGNYADLTIIDLHADAKLERDRLLQRHQDSPYTGHTFRAAIRETYCEGRRVFPDATGRGRLIRPERVST